MKIVYYPAPLHEMKREDKVTRHPSYTPMVKWGVYSYTGDYGVVLTNYKLRQFIEVNSVPFAEFKETDWIKIPKGKNCADNFVQEHITYNEHRQLQDILAAIRISSPEQLIVSINKGWLVPAAEASAYVDTEFKDKKFYRLKKTYPRSSAMHNESLIREDEMFNNYHQAMAAAEVKCATALEAQERNLAIDFAEDCGNILLKLPEGERDKCKDILSLLPYDYGFSIRYYNNEVLYRRSALDQYQSVYTVLF